MPRRLATALVLALTLVIGPAVTPAASVAAGQSASTAQQVAYPFELLVPVLMYHHIACPPTATSSPGLWICPAVFDRQMSALADLGWHTVTTAELAAALVSHTCLPERSFVVTLDDGRRDQYQNGAPILERYGFRGSFYIVVAKVGQGGHNAHFNWDQAHDLIARGHVVANHSMNHRRLRGLSPARMAIEVTAAEQILVNHGIASSPKTFVYPYGSTSPAVRTYLAADGYAMAFTSEAGTLEASNQPLYVPRLRITGSTSAFTLSNRLERFSQPCASVAIRVGSSLNPAMSGESVTFTATVVPTGGLASVPTGTVQFSIDGAPWSDPVTIDANGLAVSAPADALAVGDHTVSARYSGDDDFNAAGSPDFVQTIVVPPPPPPSPSPSPSPSPG